VGLAALFTYSLLTSLETLLINFLIYSMVSFFFSITGSGFFYSTFFSGLASTSGATGFSVGS